MQWTRAARSASLAITLLSTSVAAAQGQSAPRAPSYDARITAEVNRIAPSIIKLRHHIHQHPELGNREFETAKLIAAHLTALGFEVQTGVAHTGVVALLRGGRPGPVVAVRADMDALPVTEDTDLPFKSTVRTTYNGMEVGVSHACGHDIHVAVQLGVASVLAGMRDQIPGTIKFIFQPAEEGPPPGEEGGARLMIEQGVLDNPRPRAIFGLHASAHAPVGTVRYTPGPALSASDQFDLTIIGRQSHGAAPHLSVDPIVVASNVVLALQTIRSRNVPPLAASVLTVGMIHGGERWNIIPGQVKLGGTVRTYDGEVQDLIERRMRETIDGVTKAYGATFELDYRRNLPVTVNDLALTAATIPSLNRALGAGNVAQKEPWAASEDFSFFAREIPGFFYMLGTVKPGTTSGDHHTPTFRADDSAVPVGMKVMSMVLMDYLSR